MKMPKHLARFALFALPLLAACGTSETSTTTAEVGDTGTSSGSADVAADTRPDSTITIDVTDTGPATCAREDAFAPNQSREAAYAVPDLAFDNSDLFACAGTEDWYAMPAVAGQTIQAKFLAGATAVGLSIRMEHAAEPGVSVGSVATDATNGTTVSYTAAVDELVYVVVAAEPTGDGRYTLNVASACTSDAQCPEGTGCLLSSGVCEPIAPRSCGEDLSEPNDTASTAAVLELVDGATVLEELYTCASEPDYFAVAVPEAGTLAVSVSFRGDALLVFRVYDNTGALVSDLGSTAAASPATDTLAYLIPGQYFILVEDASTTTSLAKPYSLSVSFEAGACERDSDCISVPGRSQCVFGTCQAFVPSVPGGPAANCDSNDDCAGDLTCFFGRDGLASNRCSRECADATDCADFTGGDCIDFFGGTMCVQGCATDFECPINFTCDVPTATCSFVGCDVDADCGDGRVCRRTENQGIGFCTTIEAPACRDDDASEPNDSPGAITALLTTAGITGLQICDANDDWFVIEVTEEGKGLTLSATTPTTIDLDIFLFTKAGVAVGESAGEASRSETINAPFLATGRYLLRVNQFPGTSDALTTYNLSLSFSESRCTTAGRECLDLDPIRPVCDDATGACTNIVGDGATPLGGLCDSDSDCTPEAELCWSFQGAAGGNNICTVSCNSDADCDASVPGTICNTFRFGSICLP